MKEFDPINSMWIEKYRPKTLESFVGLEVKNKIANRLQEPQSMQHLILHSDTAGTGKTSIARIIIKTLGADALMLNGSDDRKIETIRDKVNGFVKTQSTKKGVRRIVFFDEGDKLTNDAQDALRSLMEIYHENALFIISCNYYHKISDALKSRCATIKFNQPKKEEIVEYLMKICVNENLEYDLEGLQNIVDINYPSIRNCVQVLQDLKIDNKPVTKTNAKSSDDEYQMLWDKIKEKDRRFVQEYVFTHEIDFRNLNKFFWLKSCLEDNVKMIQVTCANDLKFNEGEPIIIFTTSLIEMVK